MNSKSKHNYTGFLGVAFVIIIIKRPPHKIQRGTVGRPAASNCNPIFDAQIQSNRHRKMTAARLPNEQFGILLT